MRNVIKRAILLALALALLMMCTACHKKEVSIISGEETYLLGCEAYNAGDFDKARECWKQAVEEGYAGALVDLGMMYADEAEWSQAWECWEQAAEEGYTGGLVGLGLICANEERWDQARMYWEQAADKGNMDAVLNLGLMYFAGNGVQKDNKKALEYATRAEKLGHSSAAELIEKIKQDGGHTDGGDTDDGDTIQCSVCHGDGACFYCDGSKVEDCDRCFGSRKCDHCYGSGKVEYLGRGADGLSEIRTRDCSYCRGKGDCPKCNGSGTMKCSFCYGSGKCTTCNGRGYIYT